MIATFLLVLLLGISTTLRDQPDSRANPIPGEQQRPGPQRAPGQIEASLGGRSSSQSPPAPNRAVPQPLDAHANPNSSNPQTPAHDLSWVTTILAVGTFVFVVIQTLVMKRQSNLTKQQADTMTQQAGIMKQQADITEQSNRPRIVVRNIALDDEKKIFFSREDASSGNETSTRGTLRWVNVGTGEASVVAVRITAMVAEQLPSAYPYAPVTDLLPEPVRLPPGFYTTRQFPTEGMDTIAVEDIIQLWPKPSSPGASLFILGEIIYKDKFGFVYTTWFCRERKYGQPRFTKVMNDDYESAD